MNESQKMTKIVAVGLGLYIMITAGFTLFYTLLQLLFPQDHADANLLWTFVFGSVFSVAYAAGVLCLFCVAGDRIIAKLAGPPKHTDKDVDLLAFAFRLAAVGIGVLFLHDLLSHIVQSLTSWVCIKTSDSSFYGPNPLWPYMPRWIVLGGLSAYLLLGAPHFVRWQVRKTLEHCSAPRKYVPTADDSAKD